MSSTSVIKHLPGLAPTAVVLLYCYLGQTLLPIPERHHALSPPTKTYNSSEVEGHPVYTIEREYSLEEQVEVIHQFASQLLEKSQDIDSRFVQVVDEHFWDLI